LHTVAVRTSDSFIANKKKKEILEEWQFISSGTGSICNVYLQKEKKNTHCTTLCNLGTGEYLNICFDTALTDKNWVGSGWWWGSMP
jgi:hypothetical protein